VKFAIGDGEEFGERHLPSFSRYKEMGGMAGMDGSADQKI